MSKDNRYDMIGWVQYYWKQSDTLHRIILILIGVALVNTSFGVILLTVSWYMDWYKPDDRVMGMLIIIMEWILTTFMFWLFYSFLQKDMQRHKQEPIMKPENYLPISIIIPAKEPDKDAIKKLKGSMIKLFPNIENLADEDIDEAIRSERREDDD
jgi:hypothetical protein